MPVCVVCEEDKPTTEFTPHPRRRSGLRSECKDCRADGDRLRRYGISGQEFRRLLDAQHGLCAICPQPIDKLTAVVDHDHFCCPSGKSCGACNRGLLCDSCNRGLGFFNDDPDILDSATRYLTRRDHDYEAI